MDAEVAARKAQTRAVFERIAPEYDAGGPGCFAHFGRRLVEESGIAPGQRVLDVATGRGAVLLPAAERVGPTGAAVGIDLAEAMVRATRDEAARRGLPAEVRAMDAEALDFPDGAFDCVLCGFGVMFFPRLDRALGEFRRVLRPDGRLAVSTWRVAQADDLGATLGQLGLSGAGGDLLGFREAAELARPLEAAGFANVRVWEDTALFRYADIDDYWQTARGTGLRRWIDQLDAAQTERARAALIERVRPHQRPDGLYLAATALFATASR